MKVNQRKLTNKLIPLIGLFVALLITLSCGGSSTALQTFESYEFEGTLLDEAGDPISGATISVVGIESSSSVDSEGRFKITGFKDTQYQTITVSAPGFQAQTMTIDTYADELTVITSSSSKPRIVSKSKSSDLIISRSKKTSNKNKVKISHKTDKGFINMEVPQSALAAHLAHGDTLGHSKKQKKTRKEDKKEVLSKKTTVVLKDEDQPEGLEVTTPQNNTTYEGKENCINPNILVSGVASSLNSESFYNDVIICIDTSDSTADSAGFDVDGDGNIDTILKAEQVAAEALLERLASFNTRVGIVKFSRYRENNVLDGQISTGSINSSLTRVVIEPTEDYDAVAEALTTVFNEGPGAGTDIAAGIELSITSLNNLGQQTIYGAQEDEDGATETDEFDAISSQITPSKHIVLITDGIPTLPIEPGDTQEIGDRRATMQAATTAKNSSVSIHPIVIIPKDKSQRTLTTMPALKAITNTQSEIIRLDVEKINELKSTIEKLPLNGVPDIIVENLTTGSNTTLTVGPDGSFSGNISSAYGDNEILIYSSASADIIGTTAVSRNITIESFPYNGLDAQLAETESIKDLGGIVSPTGRFLDDKKLLKVLDDKYPNAVQIPGVETWEVDSGGSITTVITKADGGWKKNEIYYFTYDPDNPPSSHKEIIDTLTDDHLLSSTEKIKKSDYKKSRKGSVREKVTSIPAGTKIGLLIAPGKTLKDIKKSKFSKKAKRYKDHVFSTLSNLNVDRSDHFISLYDPDNSRIVFCIESFKKNGKKSKRSFKGVILDITGIKTKALQAGCDD